MFGNVKQVAFMVGLLSAASAYASVNVLIQISEPRRNGDGGTTIFGVHKVMSDNGSEVFTGLTLVATVTIETITDRGVELTFDLRNRFKVSNFHEENGDFAADVTEDGDALLSQPLRLFCHWNCNEGFILPGRSEGLFITVENVSTSPDVLTAGAETKTVDSSAVAVNAVEASRNSDEESAQKHPSAQSVVRIMYYLERGIAIIEQDDKREHEAKMWMIAEAARKHLVKLMALVEMDKLADYGIKPELVGSLYQMYAKFRTLVESKYLEQSASVELSSDES